MLKIALLIPNWANEEKSINSLGNKKISLEFRHNAEEERNKSIKRKKSTKGWIERNNNINNASFGKYSQYMSD